MLAALMTATANGDCKQEPGRPGARV
jgi:hypothetical protein